MLKDEQDIVIRAIWKLRDEALYRIELEQKIKEVGADHFEFHDYLDWLDERSYKLEYQDVNGRNVENFNLKNLIRFKLINANDVSRESSLTDTFNRILKSRYKKTSKSDIDTSINNLNTTLEEEICKKQMRTINGVLNDEVLGSDWEAVLSADITFEKIIGGLLRYDYKEGSHIFPEGQFGMGYTRLMMIIARIIEHLDSFEDGDERSRISLIAIEEPENHMHPQMQESFIRYIARVVDHLAEDGGLDHYGQLVITTHSDHIIHSKIQSGNTFNYINYVKEKGFYSEIVVLQDEKIMPSTEKGEDERELFTFLKKHMQLETNNIFFADGIVIVEGQSERLFLPPYISEKENLRQFYISIITIDGSHAHVYFNLLRMIGIPFVIITDIDFEKDDGEESSEFGQITSLEDKRTKNSTLKKALMGDEFLKNWDKNACIQYEGITIFTQTECEGYYPSSFEEALILKNYDNELLNNVLESVKPRIFNNIVRDGDKANPKNYEKNKDLSHEWQIRLNSSKGAFITALMFDLFGRLESDSSYTPSNLLEAPDYISQALVYLENRLRCGRDAN